MMRVRFPLPAPYADMAQLVERTLGKGEVGSSNLPISTTILKPPHVTHFFNHQFAGKR